MPVVATITYTGTLITAQITTSPWYAWGCVFPDSGSPMDKPQFEQEVLQPIGLDGARYRTGGQHFPAFRMITVVPAAAFADAKKIARQHEMCKGDTITIDFGSIATGAPSNPNQTKTTYQVINVKAMPNGKQVIGATASNPAADGNPPGGGAQATIAALASIDTEWMLQALVP